MTNSYYTPNPGNEAKPGQPVRSAQFNDNNDSLSQGFDLLPEPADLFTSRQNFGVATSTVANVYEVTIEPTVITSFLDGGEVVVKFPSDNTAAAQLNLNGLGVKQIRSVIGESLLAGDIKADISNSLRFNVDNDWWQLDTSLASSQEFALAAKESAESAAEDAQRAEDAADVAQAGSVPLLQPRQVGDGTTTTFSAPQTVIIDPQGLYVNIDGLKQRPVSDYTTPAIGQIIFDEAPPLGAKIDITWFAPLLLSQVDISDKLVTATGSTEARTLGDRFADVYDVKDFNNDLAAAINAANGKQVLITEDIIVTSNPVITATSVNLKGNNTSITFADTCTNFFNGYTGDFIAEGLNFIGSETVTCVFMLYSNDSHQEKLQITNCSWSGSLRWLYNTTQTINPEVTPYGIDSIIITDCEFNETLQSLFQFDNLPYKSFRFYNNNVRNFRQSFISLGISNGHPFGTELKRYNELVEIKDNSVIYSDDWWTTEVGTVVTYGVFVLHEGNKIVFENNYIEGIKSRRQTGDAGLSESSAYWLYMGATDNYVNNNVIKNCFRFGSRDTHNVAFKLKLSTNLYAQNNTITFDGNWLTRIGESISATDDIHVINDVEPGTTQGDVIFKDNIIELMANGTTYFSNFSKYFFKRNYVRKGPTNLVSILMTFPFIRYDNSTLSLKCIVDFSDNKITNEDGNVLGVSVSSTNTGSLAPLISANRNLIKADDLLTLVRVSAGEPYDIDVNDNTINVQTRGSIFGVEGIGGTASSITGANNRMITNPPTQTSQRGLGHIPVAVTTDLQAHITSEGQVNNFLMISGDIVYLDTSYVIHGTMNTSRGPVTYKGLFSLTNEGAGVSRVSFTDTDGVTPRTVDSNTTQAFFLEMESNDGATTRCYISGEPSTNNILFSISESAEGVETDPQVTYNISLYGINL